MYRLNGFKRKRDAQMGDRSSKKKVKRAPWKKNLNKAVNSFIKEKTKTQKAKEKIRRKAAKNREKKLEKAIDAFLIGGCFIVCLVAAFLEAKEQNK